MKGVVNMVRCKIPGDRWVSGEGCWGVGLIFFFSEREKRKKEPGKAFEERTCAWFKKKRWLLVPPKIVLFARCLSWFVVFSSSFLFFFLFVSLTL